MTPSLRKRGMSAGSKSSICAMWCRESRAPVGARARLRARRTYPGSRGRRSRGRGSGSPPCREPWRASGTPRASRLGFPRSFGKPTYGSSTEAVRVSRTPSAKILTAFVRTRPFAYFFRSATSRGTSEVPLSVLHVQRREHPGRQLSLRVEGGIRLEVLLGGARLDQRRQSEAVRGPEGFREAVDVAPSRFASEETSPRDRPRPRAAFRSAARSSDRARCARTADRASPSSRRRARAPSSSPTPSARRTPRGRPAGRARSSRAAPSRDCRRETVVSSQPPPRIHFACGCSAA